MGTWATSGTPTNATRVIFPSKRLDEPESSLIQRAQEGDEQAFATLYTMHKTRVYSVCLRMTKDIAEAEDFTQEVFLQVFRSVKLFRGDSTFSTWLYRIAVNTTLMKFRRRKAPRWFPLISQSPMSHVRSEKLARPICDSVEQLIESFCEERSKNCPPAADKSSVCMKSKAISIMRLPRSYSARLATQNHNCIRQS